MTIKAIEITFTEEEKKAIETTVELIKGLQRKGQEYDRVDLTETEKSLSRLLSGKLYLK